MNFQLKRLRLFGLFALSLALMALVASQPRSSLSQAPPDLPAPHLGYGLNVWDQISLAAPLQFDWLKFFEEAGPPPVTRLPEQVLYRVLVDGYPASPATYQQHIRDLVRAGRGKVEAYEIGNEVNLKGAGFWGQHDVNPELYAQLVCEVYPIIKSEDPSAIVVSAGLAPVGPWTEPYWNNVMDETVYAQRMLTQMLAINHNQFCVDAFGYHPHGFASAPETDYQTVSNGFAFRSAERMRGVMVNAGASSMQMWATEFGWIRDPRYDPWTDGAGNPSSYYWCNRPAYTEMQGFLWMEITEQQQADYLVRAFAYADAHWPWMGPMFVWNLDLYYRGTCSPQQFYSLFHATSGDPNSPAPALAYGALRSMPKRYVSSTPTLSVQPGTLTFLAEVTTPTIQTRILNIANTTPSTILTWTVTITASPAFTPTVSVANGTNAANVTIQIDTGSIGAIGTYTASLLITTTLPASGSPVEIPINVIAVQQLDRAYLPVIINPGTTP